jgi:phage terminase large subunit
VNPFDLYQPDELMRRVDAKTNKETFKNKRAQYYWRLRDRFYNSYRAVEKGEYIDPDEMISVSSEINCMASFRSEVCRVPKRPSGSGFIQIMTKKEMKDKYKIESPNLADSAMMAMEIPELVNKPKYQELSIPTMHRI